ncbi:MAG: outer membrane beta-barrel protein [Gemmataceae bacterium]
MFTSLLLTTAVAAGQPASPYYPPGTLPARQTSAPVQIPTAPAVRTMVQPTPPGTLPMAAQPTPMPGGKDFPGTESPTEQKEDKETDEDSGPTKYLLERSLEGTRFGEILNNRGIRIYGWTEMSYGPSTASGTNFPVFMNDRANEFLLNQNYVVLEKALDTSKSEFQWGWRTDWILPGSDARTTIVRGLWDVQLRNNNGGPQLYPIDLFQAYGMVYLPNLGQGTEVRLGRFATHVGYELVQAVDTPFLSRSYMFQYNPFTHTGVWANTKINDDWSMGNGIATGTDTFLDAPTNRPTYLGQLKWAPKEGDTSVAFNVVVTDPNYIPSENFQLYNFYNLVLTHKFNDKLSYVLDAGYSHMGNFTNSSGDYIGFTNWYGAAQYLNYAHTDNLVSTFRFELFDDAQGARTGFKGLYTAATYGIAWKPMPGLMIRPFARYDNNNQTEVWEGNQNLFTGGLDVIFRW